MTFQSRLGSAAEGSKNKRKYRRDRAAKEVKLFWKLLDLSQRLRSRLYRKRQPPKDSLGTIRFPDEIDYLLVGVLALLAGIATGLNLETVQRLERQAQVTFFQWRGAVAAPREVIILAIDEDSLNQGNLAARNPQKYPELAPIYQFPWQRQAYGEAIANLMNAGARSVSLDILLTSQSGYGVEDDEQLRQVLQRWGDRVVLATAHEFSGSSGGVQHYLVKPHRDLVGGEGDQSRLGLINFTLDPDGRIYRLSNDYSDLVLGPLRLDAIPSFAEATIQASRIEIQGSSSNAGDIFYYGGTRTFKTVPFWHVLDAKNWEFHRKKGTFEGKIVLIGATADSLQDFKRTPFSEQMPGVEVHANAIATLIEDRAIAPLISNSPLRGFLVFITTAGIGLLLAYPLKKPLLQLLSAIGVGMVWVGMSYLGFTAAGLIIPTTIPAIAIMTSGISILATGTLREKLERLRLYRTLERYVAEPIVNEILDRHATDFQSLLKGRKVKAAILFSDIRSFTTFSLTREPEAVVEQLNTYLEAMVEAILAEGGTLDKFIGDAVMAEFGSPISYGEKDDALRAIRAAIGMRKALVKLQKQWRATGKEILFNGIGIHYGEVIAGDIGSSKRREFAVIGDTVNVASRIEGLTGKLFVDILISESLYELVRDEVDVVDMGAHPLKGRGDNKIRLYSLVGFKGENHKLYLQVRDSLRRYLGFSKRTERASG